MALHRYERVYQHERIYSPTELVINSGSPSVIFSIAYMRVPFAGGTLKRVQIWSGNPLSSGIVGAAVFNVRINDVSQWSADARPMIGFGEQTAEKAGLSFAVAKGDVLNVDLEYNPRTADLSPITVVFEIDDGIAAGGDWKGAWSNATAYVVGDRVSYSGSSYIAVAVNTNVTPGTDAAKWNVLAAKGDVGATGSTGAAGATGSPGAAGSAGANGQGIPTGGTAGQVLSKNTSADFDASWIDRILSSITSGLSNGWSRLVSNLEIRKTTPVISLGESTTDGTNQTRWTFIDGIMYMSVNAYWDGSFWEKYDTAKSSWQLYMATDGDFRVRYADAATGAITWLSIFRQTAAQFNETGNIIATGSIKASLIGTGFIFPDNTFQTTAATTTTAVTVAGDVSGTSSANTVDKIKGRVVDPTAPTDGQVYSWNAASSKWIPATVSGGGSVTLAGDVTGANSAAVVEKLRGASLSSFTAVSGFADDFSGASTDNAKWKIKQFGAANERAFPDSKFTQSSGRLAFAASSNALCSQNAFNFIDGSFVTFEFSSITGANDFTCGIFNGYVSNTIQNQTVFLLNSGSTTKEVKDAAGANVEQNTISGSVASAFTHFRLRRRKTQLLYEVSTDGVNFTILYVDTSPSTFAAPVYVFIDNSQPSTFNLESVTTNLGFNGLVDNTFLAFKAATAAFEKVTPNQILQILGLDELGYKVKVPPPEAVALFLRPRRCAITG